MHRSMELAHCHLTAYKKDGRVVTLGTRGNTCMITAVRKTTERRYSSLYNKIYSSLGERWAVGGDPATSAITCTAQFKRGRRKNSILLHIGCRRYYVSLNATSPRALIW